MYTRVCTYLCFKKTGYIIQFFCNISQIDTYFLIHRSPEHIKYFEYSNSERIKSTMLILLVRLFFLRIPASESWQPISVELEPTL